MYESPIKMHVDEIVNKMMEYRDNSVIATITEKYNIDCNKDELLKALAYDRHQFEIGYADCREHYKNELAYILKQVETMWKEQEDRAYAASYENEYQNGVQASYAAIYRFLKKRFEEL